MVIRPKNALSSLAVVFPKCQNAPCSLFHFCSMRDNYWVIKVHGDWPESEKHNQATAGQNCNRSQTPGTVLVRDLCTAPWISVIPTTWTTVRTTQLLIWLNYINVGPPDQILATHLTLTLMSAVNNENEPPSSTTHHDRQPQGNALHLGPRKKP